MRASHQAGAAFPSMRPATRDERRIIRMRLFLALAVASIGLFLSTAVQQLFGVEISDSGHLWFWSWILCGWLALLFVPLWLSLALTAWTTAQPRLTKVRAAGARALVVVFALAVVSVVALGVVGWIASETVIHPQRKVEDYSLSQFSLPVEDVRFPSRDGTLLSGWFIPGSDRATIIVAHGYGRSRAEVLPHADYLHRAGYSVLMFDFRNRGESAGDEVTGGLREPLDVEGAVDYLLSRDDVDHNRIGVQGVSLGAASGIIAAAETPEIRAVVAESAFSSLSGVIATDFTHFAHVPAFPFAPVTTFITERRLGGDVDNIVPTKVIGRISPRPVLLIHDLMDTMIPSDSGSALYKAAGEPKELWLVPGADHARGWRKASAEYERRVLAFWRGVF